MARGMSLSHVAPGPECFLIKLESTLKLETWSIQPLSSMGYDPTALWSRANLKWSPLPPNHHTNLDTPWGFGVEAIKRRFWRQFGPGRWWRFSRKQHWTHQPRYGCGSQTGSHFGNPGKWNQGLTPALPWFNFDPYPYVFFGWAPPSLTTGS